jgi:hypothetical protein
MERRGDGKERGKERKEERRGERKGVVYSISIHHVITVAQRERSTGEI